MLWKQLGLAPGIICLTGGGGKTTTAQILAGQLPGRTIFCTTTRIFPSETLPVFLDGGESVLESALRRHGAICIGTAADNGKLAAPVIPMERLRALADYVLVEADGSKGLPLKAHLPHEPVIPDGADRRLLVVGADGFDRPIGTVAHRAERFAQLAGVSVEAPATPERIAAVLRSEGGFDTVLINQVTDPHRMERARALAALLDVPVFAGEIRKDCLIRVN